MAVMPMIAIMPCPTCGLLLTVALWSNMTIMCLCGERLRHEHDCDDTGANDWECSDGLVVE